MKRRLLAFLHVFMAVVVLLSSMGFRLVKHSCHLRGRQATYLLLATDSQISCGRCTAVSSASADNEQPNQPTVGRTACCKNEARFEHLNAPSSSLKQSTARLIKLVSDDVVLSAAPLLTFLLTYLVDGQVHAPVADYASPPPRSGRVLLAFVQTYLL